MLRTIAARNQVVTHGLKKVIRNNVTRCLSTELSRNNVQNRLLKPQQCSHRYPTQSWVLSVRGYASLPSHVKVNLPALSPTMEMGTIVRWEKKEGDKLSEGDLLCEIETDKATMGFETPEEGYLAKILIPTGTSGVPVGKLLCIIVENKDDVAAFKDFKDDSPAAAAPAAKSAAPPAAAPAAAAPPPPPKPSPVSGVAQPPAAAPAPAAPSGDRVYASPMARRLAEIRQVRLAGTGSGLYGSLKSGDLSGMGAAGAPAQAGAPSPAAGMAVGEDGATYIDIPISGMRSTIAKRMVMSKQTVPAFVVNMAINVEKTLRKREEINKRLAKSGTKITLNDIIVKAVAAAVKREPSVNAHWMDTFIRQYHQVDVSVAVATPTGLITPIVFNADSRGVIDISATIKELAGRAKEGKLRPDEYLGGTITVSNLGTSGVTSVNAIINPPQAMIIAVGGLYDVVVPDGDGFKVAKFMNFTMSGDHRVMDGIDGARFMAVLKENMEDPANIML